MKSIAVLLLSLFLASPAFAAQVSEVCDVIRRQDTFSWTQRNAEECERRAQKNFEPAAVDVCLVIARGDGFPSTQRNALECLDVVADKSVATATECLSIARSDSFTGTQKAAIACLKRKAVAAGEAPRAQQTALSIVRGSSVSAEVADLKVIDDNGGEFYWILLKNLRVTDGDRVVDVGTVVIIPTVQTKEGAGFVSQEINEAIQTGALSADPIHKVRVYIAKKDGVDSTFAQSELTRNPKDNNLVKIGAIELSAVRGDKGTTLRWGLSIPEEVVRER